MTISTIALVITGAFGGGTGGTGGSPPKDEGILKKWLDRLADALKRFAGKAVEACYCGKSCCCNFKFPWEDRWICC